MDNAANSLTDDAVLSGKAAKGLTLTCPETDILNLFSCQKRAGNLFTAKSRLRHFGVINQMLWVDATGVSARRHNAIGDGGCFVKLPRNLANRTRSHLAVHCATHDRDACVLAPAYPYPTSALEFNSRKKTFTDTALGINSLEFGSALFGTKTFSPIIDLFRLYTETLTAMLAVLVRRIRLIERFMPLKVAVSTKQLKVLRVSNQFSHRDSAQSIRPFAFCRWVDVVKLKSPNTAIVPALAASASKGENKITSALGRLGMHRKLLSFGATPPAVTAARGHSHAFNYTAFSPCKSGKEKSS